VERSDERRQLARIVDERLVAAQRHAVEVQAEAIARQADGAPGAMGGLEIDGGVSDQQRFEGAALAVVAMLIRPAGSGLRPAAESPPIT
jgi:hypothetical protein